ncbi:MAG: diguanylate cyclase [Alphaproteobacteria bacterium]
MQTRILLAFVIACGTLLTLLAMAVVAQVWMSFPPAAPTDIQTWFWASHPLPRVWYQQLPLWALYAATLLVKVWPLAFVALAGALATRLVYNHYANEEIGAFIHRIHGLETLTETLTRERDGATDTHQAHLLALDTAFEHAGEWWLVLGKDGRIRRWNAAAMAAAQRFSPTLESLEGRAAADMWPGFAGTPVANLLANAKPRPWHGDMRLANDAIHLRAWAWPLGGGDVALLAREVTGSASLGSTAATAEGMLRAMVEQSLRPIAITDLNWRYLYVAHSWPEFFHLNPQTSLVGKLHPEVVPNFPPHLPQLSQQLRTGQRVGDDEATLTLGGREEIVKWAIRPWRDSENRVGGYIITLTPTTELVRLRAQLKQGQDRENTLAYSDTLTGLPNRQLFNDRLNMAIATAYRQLSKIALIFIDLDGFKKVNDTLGHDYGDLLLKQVALRLKGALRDTDTVARLGGDEFVIILGVRDKTDAEMVAQKVLKLLHTPFDLNGHPGNIGGSLGIAMYPVDGNTGPDLIKKADAAMYEAKNNGKNTYRFASGGGPGSITLG